MSARLEQSSQFDDVVPQSSQFHDVVPQPFILGENDPASLPNFPGPVLVFFVLFKVVRQEFDVFTGRAQCIRHIDSTQALIDEQYNFRRRLGA